MAQILTVIAVCALGGFLLWRYANRIFEPDGLQVRIRLDRPEPGAHLIWEINNTGTKSVTLDQAHRPRPGKRGRHGAAGAAVRAGAAGWHHAADRRRLEPARRAIDLGGRLDWPRTPCVEAPAGRDPGSAPAPDRPAHQHHVGARLHRRRRRPRLRGRHPRPRVFHADVGDCDRLIVGRSGCPEGRHATGSGLVHRR